MRRTAMFTLLVLGIGTAAIQANWPVFRGNALQDGVSSAKVPENLEQLWVFKAKDSIEGSVAIVDGVVYAGSYDEHLYAIDFKTGQEKWKKKLGPVKASPSVKDGKVTAFIPDPWTHPLGQPLRSRPRPHLKPSRSDSACFIYHQLKTQAARCRAYRPTFRSRTWSPRRRWRSPGRPRRSNRPARVGR